MEVFTIILCAAAVLMAFYFVRSIVRFATTLAVITPIELRSNLPVLLGHIQQTSYRWRQKQVDGRTVYHGVLKRGFGIEYNLTRDPATYTLSVLDCCNFLAGMFRAECGTTVRISGAPGLRLSQFLSERFVQDVRSGRKSQ